MFQTRSQTEGAVRIQVQVKGRFGGRWVDESLSKCLFFNAIPTRINKTYPFNIGNEKK